MSTRHVFNMLEQKAAIDLPAGRRFDAVKKAFPVLDGMSAYVLEILPGCFREPHWHPNTVELSYCLKGKARVTLFMHDSLVEDFVVETGDVFFVPKGFLHYIENLDETPSRFLIVFANEEPEDFGLSGFYGSMPADVIAGVFQVEEAKRDSVPSGPGRDIVLSKGISHSRPQNYTSRYKFALESSQPLLKNPAGLVKVARKSTFQSIESLALYSLILKQDAIREPHWHPNCAEMGFVNHGNAKLIIRFPDGSNESFFVKEGDLYFIPPAYPHYIEPIDDKGLHFLIAFNAPMPQDIGISGMFSAYDPAVVAATIGTDEQHIHFFKQLHSDVFIASKDL